MTQNRLNKAAEVDGARLAVGVAGGLATGTGAYLLGRLIHGKKRKGLPWLYAMLGGAGGLAGGYAMSKDWFKPLDEQKKELEQKVDTEHTAWLDKHHAARKALEAEDCVVVMADKTDPNTWTWYDPNGSVGGKFMDLLSGKYPNIAYQYENGNAIKGQDLVWGAGFGAIPAVRTVAKWNENWRNALSKYRADTAALTAAEDAAAQLYKTLDAEYQAQVNAIKASGATLGPKAQAKLRASIFNEANGWKKGMDSLYKGSLKVHQPNKLWFGARQIASPLGWTAFGTGVGRVIRYLSERGSGAVKWQKILQEEFNK